MQLQKLTYKTHPIPDTSSVDADLHGWLLTQSEGCRFLLAHTLDAVIWGRIDQGELRTSDQAFPEDTSRGLRSATLQQCRLFGEGCEVLLWRGDDGWHARRISDVSSTEEQALDETQMLWGTDIDQSFTSNPPNPNKGFTLVCDGAEGLRHAVPLVLDHTMFDLGKQHRPLRLLVRHYLEGDTASGAVRIALSRLVDLCVRAPNGKEPSS